MNKAYKQIIKEIFILGVLYTLVMISMTIGFKNISAFLCRYYNKIYSILVLRHKAVLLQSFIYIILSFFSLFFYPYKIITLFKFKAFNMIEFIKIIFIMLSISSAVILLLNYVYILKMLKDFIKLLIGGINFSYNKIFDSRNLLPFKLDRIVLTRMILIGPIAEEIIFRGVIYNRLKYISSIIFAALISSLFFAFFHVPFYGLNIDIFTIFIIGILLVYGYEMSKTIWMPIIVHMCYNAFIELVLKHINKYFHEYIALIIYFIIFIAGIIIAIQEIKKHLKVRKSFNLVQPASLPESEK